jgi:hypothetical protein
MQHMPPMQQHPPVQQQQQQPQSDWSEHAGPTGRKYYFNRVTKVSTWTKPEELMTPEVRDSNISSKSAMQGHHWTNRMPSSVEVPCYCVGQRSPVHVTSWLNAVPV